MLRGVTLPDTRAAEVNLLPTRIDSPRIVYHSLFPFEILNFLSLSFLLFLFLKEESRLVHARSKEMINETRNRGRNYFEDIWKSAGTSSITRGKKRRYRGRGDYPDGAKKWLKRWGLRRVCVANRRGPSRATLPPSSTSRADLLATYTPNLTCNGSSKTAESDRQTEGEEERVERKCTVEREREARGWSGVSSWPDHLWKQPVATSCLLFAHIYLPLIRTTTYHVGEPPPDDRGHG